MVRDCRLAFLNGGGADELLLVAVNLIVEDLAHFLGRLRRNLCGTNPFHDRLGRP
jgi:hypothetical protein